MPAFPLEVRCKALVEAFLAEPEPSVRARAELVMADGGDSWPAPVAGGVETAGLASTQAERDEVVALLEAGWTVGQVADSTAGRRGR